MGIRPPEKYMVNTSIFSSAERPGRSFRLSGNASRMVTVMDSDVPTTVINSVFPKDLKMLVELKIYSYPVSVKVLGMISRLPFTTSL